MYNVFGSGATHGIHAQFIAQSALANREKRVGMLRGASTRFASWFYAMMRLLGLKDPLRATITQVNFQQLDLNDRARSALLILWMTFSGELFFAFLALFFQPSASSVIVTLTFPPWTSSITWRTGHQKPLRSR